MEDIFEQAENENKIVAVVKYPYQKSEVIAIDKGLSPIQKIVGGNIDSVYLPNIEDVHGFCNDEGLLIGLERRHRRPSNLFQLRRRRRQRKPIARASQEDYGLFDSKQRKRLRRILQERPNGFCVLQAEIRI